MTNKRDFHNAQSVCFLLVKGREEEMRLSLNNHLFVVNIQSKNHDPIKLSTFPWEETEKGMRKLTGSRESMITSTHCACTRFEIPLCWGANPRPKAPESPAPARSLVPW
jgi:hypothetical protein